MKNQMILQSRFGELTPEGEFSPLHESAPDLKKQAIDESQVKAVNLPAVSVSDEKRFSKRTPKKATATGTKKAESKAAKSPLSKAKKWVMDNMQLVAFGAIAVFLILHYKR